MTFLLLLALNRIKTTLKKRFPLIVYDFCAFLYHFIFFSSTRSFISPYLDRAPCLQLFFLSLRSLNFCIYLEGDLIQVSKATIIPIMMVCSSYKMELKCASFGMEKRYLYDVHGILHRSSEYWKGNACHSVN